MLRQLLKDSAVYGASRILVQGLSFLMVPLYTRVLTPRDFGAMDVITVVATIATIVVALEVGQGLARYFADARDEREKAVYASTSLWFGLVAYTTFALVALLFAARISVLLLESAEFAPVIRMAVFSTWSNGLLLLVLNQLRWDLKPVPYSIASFVYTFTTLAGTVLMVVVLRWALVGFFLAQLIGNLAGLGVAFHFSRGRFGLHFDAHYLRRMLKFSLPLVPSSIGVLVTLYVDRFAIKEFRSLEEVGVFGVGYRLAAVVGLLVGGFQRALTPLIYANYAKPETPAQLARVFRYFVGVAALLCLGLALFSREIMRVFAAPGYQAAATVAPLLAAAVILSNTYIFAPGLDIAKRTGIIALINVAGAGLTFGLNLLLVPRWGIQGAAVATCASAAAVLAAYMITSQRLYPIPYRWSVLAGGTAGAVGLSLVAAPLVAGGGWVSGGLRVLVLLLGCALLSVLGLLPLGEGSRLMLQGGQQLRLRLAARGGRAQ